EPPIVFPAPAVWKELSERRRKRFGYMGFGDEMPPQAFKLLETIDKTVTVGPEDAKIFQNDPKITVKEALDWLATKYKFTYTINEKALEIANNGTKVEELMGTSLIGDKGAFPVLNEVSVKTVLQKILDRMPGDELNAATWMIRRDTIEITSKAAQINEKSIRVF